jgi:hypothetical protein
MKCTAQLDFSSSTGSIRPPQGLMEQLVGCELQQMRAAAATAAGSGAAKGAQHAVNGSTGVAFNFLQVCGGIRVGGCGVDCLERAAAALQLCGAVLCAVCSSQ